MMKFFKNSGHGMVLDDYQTKVIQCRHDAEIMWRKNCKVYNTQNGFSSEILPPFFADKYGFRNWLGSKYSSLSTTHVSIPETDFSTMFELYDGVVRDSVVGSKLLGMDPPQIERMVTRSGFLNEQFKAWQKHLCQNGINLPSETIDWYFSVPLLEVYHKSVFYPRYPVLWGPNYFNKVADKDRVYILEVYGAGAVWDFYFLMMVCHEQSHLIQKGEPILNEITHAILWIDFILKQNLTPFQINSETSKTCNIEAPFILGRIDSLRGKNYGLMFEDNYIYFEREVLNSKYTHFVAAAFLVHARVLHYRYVVNLFCGLLARDDDVCRYLSSCFGTDIAVVLDALIKGADKLTLRNLVKSQMPVFGVIQP